MVRVKCICSYDGSGFYGFQIQPNYRSVQGEIQKALKQITQEEITIHGSGRTDAGVHAYGQVFHFDTKKDLPEKQWKRAINHFMPSDIHILDTFIVDEDFHSRYSASYKEYIYKLNMGEYNPIESKFVAQVGWKLDVEKMKDAASLYLGCHNFASFCAQDPYGNTFRTVYNIQFIQNGEQLEIHFIGDGFRRYQIRYMVGALIRIGNGRLTKEGLHKMIQSEGKIKCLHKAKAEGLYLNKVGYGSLYE